MRIRAQLLLIAAVVFVPGFLAAVVAVDQVRDGERQAALRGLRETVRASALLVDREIQRSIGALTALGQSDHLRTGNFQGFYKEALAVNQAHVWTLLLDDTGAQVLNTAVPFGTPPPPPTAAERVAQVLATNRVLVTDLINGPVTGKLLTTLYMPTKEWNGKRYVVAQAFSVDHWKTSALNVKNGSSATIAVIDRAGRFISRNLNAEARLGQLARPELVAAAASANEGLIRHSTLEGVDSYDAFTHSDLTGWTVAVAAPVGTIEASATRAVFWLGAAGVLALAAAIIAATFQGRTFIHVIDVASRGAGSVGKGVIPVMEKSTLQEVNELYQAIADAGGSIASERRSREAAERERYLLLERETALREEAQRQNTAKDHFLALLGHELRNPLAAISGATAVLGNSRTAPEAKEKFLAIIQRQNRHLSHIVDDLLDVSRLVSGKIELETTFLNLADCVRRCVEALRATERAAGHLITIQAEDVWVQGDPVRLEQIVNNLVSNSLKCSPPGTEIRVSVRDTGSEALVEVKDQGMGIEPALMPHIFEPFVQGPPKEGSMPSGLGIGLALVKQLIALHGGQVCAESQGNGTGATFRVTLPKATQITPLANTADEAALVARHVLLVEDDVDAMETTTQLLHLMGHRVTQARNYAEVLQAMASAPFDAVVMDLGLPGKNGYQIATELRQLPAMQAVPMIALTGYGQEADRTRALAAGFNEHLTKPVDPATLMKIIDERTREV
ncbi:MAG: response regulator [Cytophagales bacterium]|nr:response regulator [Rhizobacter sp.]